MATPFFHHFFTIFSVVNTKSHPQISMSNREETLRADADSSLLAKELIKELLDETIPVNAASDVLSLITLGTDPTPPKTSTAGERARIKVRRKVPRHVKRANRKKANEERFAALMLRVKSGDPSAPDYDNRLSHAKRSTRMREVLPHVARKKWGNEKFQKMLEERGWIYDYAQWKGWLPYDDAKALEQRLIGAKSRGEYEVYMKLFVIRFLPARPDRVYGDNWKGWNDFLGTTNVFGPQRKESVNLAEYRSFYEALTFARSLKLNNLKEWKTACKSGLVPIDVPIDPYNVYAEFVDVNHWLGVTTAEEIVNGVVVIKDVWALYTDGRQDACWWAKMSVEKYREFKDLPNIHVVRAYEFEGELANNVWQVLDAYSTVYADDRRERMVEQGMLLRIVGDLDGILKWVR